MRRQLLLLASAVVVAIVAVAILVFTSDGPQYTEKTKSRAVLGNPAASIRVVEYTDYECPACREAQSMIKSLLQSYGGAVAVDVKHFPLRTIHRYAGDAAEAAECANDQGKFAEYHDYLYEHQEQLDRQFLTTAAGAVGLDQNAFSACMASHAKLYVVKQDEAEVANLKLDHTPTFFLDGQEIQNWTQIPQLVQQKLDAVSAPASAETNK